MSSSPIVPVPRSTSIHDACNGPTTNRMDRFARCSMVDAYRLRIATPVKRRTLLLPIVTSAIRRRPARVSINSGSTIIPSFKMSSRVWIANGKDHLAFSSICLSPMSRSDLVWMCTTSMVPTSMHSRVTNRTIKPGFGMQRIKPSVANTTDNVWVWKLNWKCGLVRWLTVHKLLSYSIVQILAVNQSPWNGRTSDFQRITSPSCVICGPEKTSVHSPVITHHRTLIIILWWCWKSLWANKETCDRPRLQSRGVRRDEQKRESVFFIVDLEIYLVGKKMDEEIQRVSRCTSVD